MLNLQCNSLQKDLMHQPSCSSYNAPIICNLHVMHAMCNTCNTQVGNVQECVGVCSSVLGLQECAGVCRFVQGCAEFYNTISCGCSSSIDVYPVD